MPRKHSPNGTLVLPFKFVELQRIQVYVSMAPGMRFLGDLLLTECDFNT